MCSPHTCCWIVDSSIECYHQRFDGFLKIPLKELLIALRDDRHLLHHPDGMFAQTTPAACVPVHPPAHLGGFFGGFGQRVKHGNGVDVLAGDGRAEFKHFGIFCVFRFFTEK